VLSDGDARRLGEAADALQAEAAAAGCRLEQCVVDVRRLEDVERLLKRCQDAFGRVDLFFNNAGVIGEPARSTRAAAARGGAPSLGGVVEGG
jgi:NAD(P)-dependent dehydrogenase (short-subunit alcohol dehydrogenase family)